MRSSFFRREVHVHKMLNEQRSGQIFRTRIGQNFGPWNFVHVDVVCSYLFLHPGVRDVEVPNSAQTPTPDNTYCRGRIGEHIDFHVDAEVLAD